MRTWLRRHWPNAAAFAWGVAEATLFFIVPDVLLSYIGLKRGPRGASSSSPPPGSSSTPPSSP